MKYTEVYQYNAMVEIRKEIKYKSKTAGFERAPYG